MTQSIPKIYKCLQVSCVVVACLSVLASLCSHALADRPLEMKQWAALKEHKNAKPNPFYLERRIAPTMTYEAGAAWLARPEREVEENAKQMLDNLGLKPGMVIADFGCGIGYHSIPIAKVVGPEGKVVAIDLQREMLRSLVANAKEQQVENIEPVLAHGNVCDMPQAAFDLLLMVDVYHELSLPAETLQEIRGSLKPDGVIALCEFRGEDPDVPIFPVHKMSKAQILKEYEANGFELKSSYDELPWQHLMFFKVKKD